MLELGRRISHYWQERQERIEFLKEQAQQQADIFIERLFDNPGSYLQLVKEIRTLSPVMYREEVELAFYKGVIAYIQQNHIDPEKE